MSVFVDTSAFVALGDQDDAYHAASERIWERLALEDVVTHNYAVIETAAVLQRRGGLRALGGFFRDLLPRITVHWVDQPIHDAAVAALLLASSRKLSLVDLVSFEFMRLRGIDTAFAFDDDFRRAGFQILVTKR